MKQLILLRHAEAVPEHAAGDMARPLTPRGKQQVQLVAQSFVAQGIRPALALVSPATRTKQTAQLLANSLDNDLPIAVDHSLYLATDEQFVNTIASIPDDIHSILLVGHNPGISDLATSLDAKQANHQLPTAGFVVCQIPTQNWRNIRH